MNSEEIIGRNLWGEPVYRVSRKRGRPPFEWTEENSHKVSMLLAMGWGNDRIAGVVLDPRTGQPISVPTLKRHFRAELKVRDRARDMLKAKQLMAAGAEAFSGNVGAMRFFEQLVKDNDAALASARIKGEGKDEKKTPTLGKKAEAKEQAKAVLEDEARGLWGSDLNPGYEN